MKCKIYLSGLIILLLMQGFQGLKANEELLSLKLDSAKELYDKDNFDEGLLLLQKAEADLNQQNLISFELYYNLGNFYFRKGLMAQAVLNYEKALLVDPTNEDAVYNLKLVNQQLQDEFEEIPEVSFSALFNYLNSFFSYQILFAIGFCCTLGLSLIVFWRKKKNLFVYSSKNHYILGMGVVLMLWSWAQYSAVQTKSKEGVILENRTAVTSEPNPSAQLLLKINEGTKVKLLEKGDDWYRVQLPNNVIGWLSSTALLPIELP